MTDALDGVPSMLAGEYSMLANPEADPFGDYNKPADLPANPAEYAALIEKTMRDMWERPVRWHGTASNPHITHPRGRYCIDCGEDVGVLLARQRIAEDPFAVARNENEDRAEWVTQTRERLQSAVYAASHGYGWNWDGPGVFGVPGVPEWLQVRDATEPWRPTEREECDA